MQEAFFDSKKFSDTEFPKPEFLLEPWLVVPSYNLIYAGTGTGKTYFCLDIAIKVAIGGKMLNWRAAKPTGILYIDGEVGCGEMKERILALNNGTIPLNFNFLGSTHMISLGGSALNLIDPEWRREFIHLLQKLPDVKLIVFDNVSNIFTGIDEQSKELWDAPNAFLVALRSLGYCVILIHHAGKNPGSGQRGTSAREDSVNMSIRLTKIKGQTDEDGAKFEIEWKKSRGITGIAVRKRKVELVNCEHPYFKDYIGDTEQEVRTLLEENEEEGAIMSIREIGKKLNKPPATIQSILKRIKEADECYENDIFRESV